MKPIDKASRHSRITIISINYKTETS